MPPSASFTMLACCRETRGSGNMTALSVLSDDERRARAGWIKSLMTGKIVAPAFKVTPLR